jgi:hypothetical protein
MTTLQLRISGSNLPGRQFESFQDVHLGIQHRAESIDIVPGDATGVTFDLTVEVVPGGAAGFDFRGPYVHGKRGERFLYLSWGDLTHDGSFAMFRRAKLHLSALDPADVVYATATGTIVEGHLGLTDGKGGPLCAAVRPPAITWRVGAAAGA